MDGLKKAIKAAGSLRELGEAIGITGSGISMWQQRGRIPAEYVLKIEAATGVPRYELRPDLYQAKEAA
jgi:DNA-binding transcriptional regulator YdaS (Cro superfamily)